MSQEELTVMATDATEMATGTRQQTWMERNSHLFPRFFTKSVVANREGKVPPVSPLPTQETWHEPVRQKLDRKPDGAGRTTHVMLHLDPKDGSFSIKFPAGDQKVKVSRDMLKNAIAHVQGSPWVCLQIGANIVRLARSELKDAVHKLEAKLTPKSRH